MNDFFKSIIDIYQKSDEKIAQLFIDKFKKKIKERASNGFGYYYSSKYPIWQSDINISDKTIEIIKVYYTNEGFIVKTEGDHNWITFTIRWDEF